ncbi:MAG: UDP-N-acetylmuramoyl-tripeptide--D-alanyl-D-alanine ligase [Acidimicrobiaceae bacterium]|nr:UDP-N-acetylmuramoyl-tripeptide--D-alanyl-D-alanine ligase [Acidimicrobiaceae bacterium]
MSSTIAQVILFAAALVAAGLAGVRWLRVAQREHYLPGSVVRFARRWWSIGPNRLLGAAALLGLAGAAAKVAPAGLVAVAAVAAGPFGLGLRGRTSALVWTRRLKVLAAVAATLAAAAVALAVAAAPGWTVAAAAATLAAVAAPVIVDLALVATRPLERRLGAKFVRRATAKLAAVHPKVVAITGSYGKTGTKGYIAHLVTGSLTVVATPKSYNNQSGLSRAVNDHLLPATDVFVAEMGTYGPGEIAEMCAWVTPDIAVITAIGPVHLERMKDEATITRAKAEILERAEVAVLNIDSPWLAPLADQRATDSKKVWRCSAVDRRADVCVAHDDGALRVFIRTPGGGNRQIAHVKGSDAPPTNVACAVAVALELGVDAELIGRRLPGLQGAPHRREVSIAKAGATVIDDTYNANPAGAAAALRLLAGIAGLPSAKRVVVTPGMVELGDRQDDENAAFGQAAAAVASHLLVIGQTNAKALIAGARRVPESERAEVLRFTRRDDAVGWVTEHLGPGDAVLYENDLPDHHP